MKLDTTNITNAKVLNKITVESIITNSHMLRYGFRYNLNDYTPNKRWSSIHHLRKLLDSGKEVPEYINLITPDNEILFYVRGNDNIELLLDKATRSYSHYQPSKVSPSYRTKAKEEVMSAGQILRLYSAILGCLNTLVHKVNTHNLLYNGWDNGHNNVMLGSNFHTAVSVIANLEERLREELRVRPKQKEPKW